MFTSHWVWWVGEILGACLAVFVTRCAFAPVFTGDEESSGTWWWRVYLHYNRVMADVNFEETAEPPGQSWGKVRASINTLKSYFFWK